MGYDPLLSTEQPIKTWNHIGYGHIPSTSMLILAYFHFNQQVLKSQFCKRMTSSEGMERHLTLKTVTYLELMLSLQCTTDAVLLVFLWKCKLSHGALWVYCGTPGDPGTNFGNHRSRQCYTMCALQMAWFSKLLVSPQ